MFRNTQNDECHFPSYRVLKTQRGIAWRSQVKVSKKPYIQSSAYSRVMYLEVGDLSCSISRNLIPYTTEIYKKSYSERPVSSHRFESISFRIHEGCWQLRVNFLAHIHRQLLCWVVCEGLSDVFQKMQTIIY